MTVTARTGCLASHETENLTRADTVFVMPTVITVPPVPGSTVDTLTVVDNPGYAWDESDQAAIYSLDRGFVSAHRELLDAAAYDLIRPHLVAAWSKRGRVVRFEDDRNRFTSDTTPGDPADTTYHAVWQDAADQVTTEALLDRAGFTAVDTRTYA